jgi:hypothetical protein
MATISPTSLRTARCLATIAFLAAFAALAPGAARAASPDAVQFDAGTTMPAGSSSGTTNLTTIPAGKRLVIQTINYYRHLAASGSIGQMLVTTTVNGSEVSYFVPEVPADGALYPTTTAAVTLYADPGTTPSIAFYRNGSLAGQEDCIAAVSGYYVTLK